MDAARFQRLRSFLPPDKQRELDACLAAARPPKPPPDLLADTFDVQRAFIEDPARLKLVLCTRRSGKSFGAAVYMLQEALDHPGVSILYVGLTRESAWRIIGKDCLKVIDRRHGLGAKYNETTKTMTLPNGSVIYVLGVDANEGEKDKLFGQKYRLVCIDEAALYTIDLRNLVYGTLKPATVDQLGTICMLGMPSDLKSGLFFDLTKGQDASQAGRWTVEGWSAHRWSALDNPHVRDNFVAEMEQLKADKPGIENTPLFKRNFLGQWDTDDSQFVYRFNPARNIYDQLPKLPEGGWHHVLSLDLGYNDPTAIVVGAYHDQDPRLWIVHAESEAELLVDEVARRVKELAARYSVEDMVVDPASKQVVEDLRRRHGLPLRAADKHAKKQHIELMNTEFMTGRIFVHRHAAAALIAEYGNLVWKSPEDHDHEHPACKNDQADSSLYLFRHVHNYAHQAPKRVVEVGSQEWEDEQMEEAIEKARRRSNPDPWGDDPWGSSPWSDSSSW